MKRQAPYIPRYGDIVWLDFNPTRGHEQAGYRPALVVSATEFNRHFDLVFVCPITSRKRDHAFEVELGEIQTRGVVLAHQVRTIDARKRKVRFVEQVPQEVVEEVVGLIGRILGR